MFLNRNQYQEVFHINIITQDLMFMQSVVKYYYRNGETATAAQYKISRRTVYRMMIKMGIYKKTPSKKKEYEPKEYHQMTYPGERV